VPECLSPAFLKKSAKQLQFIQLWCFVEFCREILKKNYVDMRTLDRAFGKKENQ